MASRPLVIDANILIRAVLGVRVRALIERYSDSVAFYVAEPNFEEAAKYLGELAVSPIAVMAPNGDRRNGASW